MTKSSHVAIETVVILGVLFLLYVVGDVVTTLWLIANHPLGIMGESNPLAILLYTQQGVYGLITTKLLVFIAISLMAIVIEFHYNHARQVMLISNYSILGLMALSLIVVTVNVMLIYTLSLQQGGYESNFLFRTYIVIFAITLAGLILLPKFVPSALSIVEIILAFVVILGPLAFSPGIYQFLLAQNIVNFSVYIGINTGIIVLMIFSLNRLYKHIIPKKKSTN